MQARQLRAENRSEGRDGVSVHGILRVQGEWCCRGISEQLTTAVVLILYMCAGDKDRLRGERLVGSGFTLQCGH